MYAFSKMISSDFFNRILIQHISQIRWPLPSEEFSSDPAFRFLNNENTVQNLDHFRFYLFVQSEKRSELTYDPGGWHIKILPFRTWIRRHFHQYIGMFLDDFLSSEFSMFHLSVEQSNCPMTRVQTMKK